MKKILFSVVVVAMLWSCGKDDGPSTPPASAKPTITDFNPKTGPVGTEVTITGTNFSTTKTDNVVKVRNSLATVSSASATELKITVPAGAETGKITVAVDGETAATATDFTITLLVAENSVPEFSEIDPISAKEDITAADQIAQLGASDADGDNLTFMLEEDESGLFAVSEDGVLTLAEGKTLDFETAASHSITVSVTDGEETVDATIAITVEDVAEADPKDKAAFVTTWKTEADGEEILFYINDVFEYNFTVNWGDGTIETIDTFPVDGKVLHSYDTAGSYKVAILGAFPYFGAGASPNILGLEQWGNIEWESFYLTFASAINMVYNASDAPNLSKVTTMARMFDNAKLFDGDLSDWDISNVTDLSGMFTKTASFKGEGLSSWTTEQVTDMSFMFFGATSFNGDISGWDTGNVSFMNAMFYGAESFNGSISDWKTENVIDMSFMFFGATSFNGDVSGWNTSNVSNFEGMFSGASVFNQNLGNWDIGNVSIMDDMLDGSGMSAINFSNTLIGWAAQEVQPNVILGAAGLHVCLNDAAGLSAVSTLTSEPNNWEFVWDGLKNCN